MKTRKAGGTALLLMTIAAAKTATADDRSLYLQKLTEQEKCRSQISLTLAERLGVRENLELDRCLEQSNLHNKAFSALDTSYNDQNTEDGKFRESLEASNLTNGATTLTMSKQNNNIEFDASSFRQVQDKASQEIVDTLDGYTSKRQ